MATDFPCMPLWIDTFTAETAHMTARETGSYVSLLVAMWRAGGALANDDKRLARWAKLTPGQWRRMKPLMMEFLHIESGVVTHNGLLKSLEAVRRRSQSASRSAHAKWLKTKDPAHASASPTLSERNAIAMLIKTEESSPSSAVVNAREEEGRREEGGGPIEVSDFLRTSRVVRGGGR